MFKYQTSDVMKRTLFFLVVCLSLSLVGNAQTKKTIRKPVKAKTTQTVAKTPEPPSANGKFKYYSNKGFLNDTDQKDYVVITAEGKTASDIKSSVVSTLSSMYSNPSKVISTIGDNIINVTGYASDAFQYLFVDRLQHYSFTYNIKIEIKDGKVKIDSPSFSNVFEKVTFMGETIGTDYLDTQKMYWALNDAKELQQAKVENIFNSHVTKIVSGLSSNSDW